MLVVEDDFLISMELEAVLRQEDFQILGPASSVAAALRTLQGERPDAAVLDVSLRGEWVTPVAEVLRQMEVPYVLTSAYAAEDLAVEPSLAAARNLGKPTPAAKLIAAVRQLLEPSQRPD